MRFSILNKLLFILILFSSFKFRFFVQRLFTAAGISPAAQMGRYYSPAATVAAYGSLGAASMAAAAAVAAQHNAISAHAAQHNQVSLSFDKYSYFWHNYTFLEKNCFENYAFRFLSVSCNMISAKCR